LVAVLDRFQSSNGCLGKEGLESAPTHICAFLSSCIPTLPAEDGVEAQQIVGFRTLGIVEFQPHLRVGFGALDFLCDQLWWVQKGDPTALIGIAFAHLAAPVGEAHNPCTFFEDQGFGHFQYRGVIAPEAGIDPLLSDISCEL